jgi:CheY-like chemotaxis protein
MDIAKSLPKSSSISSVEEESKMEIKQGDKEDYNLGTKVIFISQIKQHLQELFEIIAHVRDTNQFMIMTINRCIDHSKVINDIALLASNTSFNLVETVNFPVDCIRRMQSHVQVAINIDESLQDKVIISDKLWLNENIFCLLSNAVRYSEGGSAELRINKVDAHHPSRSLLHNAMHRQLPVANKDVFLLVELVDSGKGVEADKISMLFAPFKQAQRRSGGTGLGLFALACRMRTLGGYYGVRQREDSSGSIFWFAITYIEDDILSNAVASATAGTAEADGRDQQLDSASIPGACDGHAVAAALPAISPFSSLSILLVDDAYSIQKVLSRILQRKGHQVDVAENGLKAIRTLGVLPKSTAEQNQAALASTASRPHRGLEQEVFASHYDVVLMDLQMPVMDGFEAIRSIREHELSMLQDDAHPQAHQLIIAMSANSDEGTVQEALHEGADYFMVKPFHIDSFQKLYDTHMSKQ